MERESRVKKTLLNARINTLCYLAMLVVTFFTRKIFLDNLGTDFIGLTTTTQSILSFLNLAELGIGTAISAVLYKPVFDNDQEKIKEIVSVLGYLYRKVGLAILTAGIILSCFLPFIFADTPFSWGIIYLAFYASLSASLIGYFVNYRTSLLSADQKNYIVTGYFQVSSLSKTILQAFLVIYFKSFALYLIIELLFGIINSIILNYKIDKTYPWLKTEIKKGKQLFKEYPTIGKYMKQLFIHRIGGFVHGQLAPLLIYGYVSLSTVALYGNYTILITRISGFFSGILDSTGASIGNLIAEGNQKKTYQIFEELFSVRFLVAGILTMCVWHLGDSFISIWLGSEYLLPRIILALVSANMFLNFMYNMYSQFLNGFKLFADIWVPFARISSILLCLLGGYFWGMAGILGAQIFTTMLLLNIWKPYYLFRKGFKLSFFRYIGIFTLNVVELLGAYFAVSYICRKILSNTIASNSWMEWITEAVVFTIMMAIITFAISFISQQSTRNFTVRFIKARSNK